MEAFVFDITLPTDWSQLTDKQLAILLAYIAPLSATPNVLCLNLVFVK